MNPHARRESFGRRADSAVDPGWSLLPQPGVLQGLSRLQSPPAPPAHRPPATSAPASGNHQQATSERHQDDDYRGRVVVTDHLNHSLLPWMTFSLRIIGGRSGGGRLVASVRETGLAPGIV